MISFTNFVDKNSNIRLIDVFLFGPIQICSSFYIKNSFIKIFMFLTGIFNIIFNGHNYLLQDIKVLEKPIYLLRKFINNYSGKTQLQKLYNIFLMYPLFIYIVLLIDMPDTIKIILSLNIIGGILYNFGSFLQNKKYYK